MPLRMWTYDLAREQAPSLDHLRRLCDLSLESGYNALGLYLEHRFAYPSTPWSHGIGCLTPEMVRALQEEYRTLELIPFINLLGHVEGFLYTETGRVFAETRFKGMQACPSKPEFIDFANKILDDTLSIFKSSIIHIGGDETEHLGACPECRARVQKFETNIGVDGKARLFGDHFGPLSAKVIEAGRRPAIWGDMLFEHPQAMVVIPKDTLIFDWQYFQSAGLTGQKFRKQGFEVVYCPTLHVYNATWLHLPQSERNVRENIVSAEVDSAYGVCLTTWECELFGNYETLLPAIQASGEMMCRSAALAAEDEERRRSTPASEIQFELSKPLLEPSDDVLQVTAGLVDGILAAMMDRGASDAIVTPGTRFINVALNVNGTLHDHAKIPNDPGQATVHRLAMLAGMDPTKSTERRAGVISGRYKEVPFEIFSLSEPTGHGIKFTLSITPWKNSTAYAPERKAELFLKSYLRAGETYEEWARLMGIELQNAGGAFTFGGIRSGLKCRMLLYSNPFLVWLNHREELCGPVGDAALSIFERGITFAPDASARGVSDFAKSVVQFVRFAEESHQAYATGHPAIAATALNPCRQIFDNLTKIARSNHLRIGGSLADIERCQIAKEHIERVMRRIKHYGDGSLGYTPSFEMITHPNFMPHDQGAWWMINSWARE